MNLDNDKYVSYHDNEWGRPAHDEHHLFEMLILEGAQAGLSWETILNKRERYREVFAQFNPEKVARFTQAHIEKLLLDPGIVRNRLKIQSTITNAKSFLKIQKEFGTFDAYLWGFVEGKPISNRWKTLLDYPAQTPLSQKISKDLLKRGFKFVGPTIIYAYMQAIGMVNDHSEDCYKSQVKHWYLYLIECKDKSLYTGITTDVKARFKVHCEGGPTAAKYLKGKGPLKLVFQKKIGTKSQALKAELAVKKLKVSEKRRLIADKKLPMI